MDGRISSDAHFSAPLSPNRGQPNPLPQLAIKGRWLEALGFRTGQPVIVAAERGRLTIEFKFKF